MPLAPPCATKPIRCKVEAINKFLRELRRLHPGLHARVDPELIRKYVEREGEGCFASTGPSETKQRLPDSSDDLLALATQFRGTAADAEARKIKPSVVLAESHCGSNENLERARQQGVEVVSPSMSPKGSKQEKLTLERFELDEAGRVTTARRGTGR